MALADKPHPQSEGPWQRSPMIMWGVAGLTTLMVLGPILPIVAQAFLDRPLYEDAPVLTLANFVRLFTEDQMLEIVWNTVVFAFLTTAVAQLFGVLAAILVGRTNVPGRRWIGELLIWPLFVSHLVIAFGWFVMYGPSGYLTLAIRGATGITPWNIYTLTGMGIVAGLSQAPLAYLLCLASVTKANAQLEDAARVSGAGPFRALLSITLPMMRPAIVYSTVLNFVVAIEMLSIPLLFGGPRGVQTITTFIYSEGIEAAVQPDYGLVGAVALILVMLVAGLIWLQGRLMQGGGRFITVSGKASRPATLDLGRWKWPAFAALFGYVFFTIIIVFSGVFLRSGVTFLTPLLPIWQVLTLEHFVLIFENTMYFRSITNSLLVALVGGAIGTAIVAVIALVAQRSDFRFGRSLEYVALFPRALPGIIAGLGFFYAVIAVPGLDAVRGTIIVLIVAFIVRYIPVGFAAIAPALVQIGAELDQSARTTGADWWSAVTRIVLPLLRPALFSCFALLFIHFFKEYVAAVFLYQPGSEMIGTTMLQLWAQGDNGPVSALATVQVILTAIFVLLARKALGANIYG